jgi:hypothetical protein
LFSREGTQAQLGSREAKRVDSHSTGRAASTLPPEAFLLTRGPAAPYLPPAILGPTPTWDPSGHQASYALSES